MQQREWATTWLPRASRRPPLAYDAHPSPTSPALFGRSGLYCPFSRPRIDRLQVFTQPHPRSNPHPPTLDESVESALLTSNAAIPQLSRCLLFYRSEWAWRLGYSDNQRIRGLESPGKSITRTFAGRFEDRF